MYDVMTSSMLLICYLLFGTPFLLFAATRKSWRAITIYAVVATVVLSGLIYIFSTMGDFGLIFLVLLFLPAAVSYFAGTVIAVIVHVLHSNGKPKSVQKLVFRWLIGICYVLVISYLLLFPVYENRSPDESCQQRFFSTSIGERQLNIPASSPIIISIAAVKLSSPLNANKYLRDAQHLRLICEYAKNGNEVIKLKKIDFHFDKLWFAIPGSIIIGQGYYKNFCEIVSESKWGRQLCDTTISPTELGFPNRLTLFTQLPNLAGYGEHYEDFYRQVNSFKKKGYVKNIEQIGDYDRIRIHLDYIHNFDKNNPLYYWVARDGGWHTPDGNPHFLRCKAATEKGLKCSTLYQISTDFYVKYTFYSQLENIPESAKRVDDKVYWLLDQLSDDSN